MTKIIDLGNGYGRFEGYSSPYANLTFPLDFGGLGRLCAEGYMTKMDLQQALLDIGHSEEAAAWFVSLTSVTTEQWKARLPNARTI